MYNKSVLQKELNLRLQINYQSARKIKSANNKIEMAEDAILHHNSFKKKKYLKMSKQITLGCELFSVFSWRERLTNVYKEL